MLLADSVREADGMVCVSLRHERQSFGMLGWLVTTGSAVVHVTRLH